MKSLEDMLDLCTNEEALILDKLDGKQTIQGSKGIFDYIHPDFEKYNLNVPGVATEEVFVDLYKLNYVHPWKYTLRQIFSVPTGDFRDVCLTQDQVLNFIKKHGSWVIEDGGWGVFFPVKTEKDYFVLWVSYFFGQGDSKLPCVIPHSFHDGKLFDSELPTRLITLKCK